MRIEAGLKECMPHLRKENWTGFDFTRWMGPNFHFVHSQMFSLVYKRSSAKHNHKETEPNIEESYFTGIIIILFVEK